MAFASLVSPGGASNGGLEHSLSARITTNAAEPITVGFWLNWDDTGSNDTVFASNTGREQTYTLNSGNKLETRNDGAAAYDTTIITPGTWYHYHRVFYGTSVEDEAWVNGTSVGTAAITTSEIDQTTGKIWLLQDDGADGDWDGKVFGFYIIDGEYSPTDCTYDTVAGEFQDLTGAALTNAWCYLTGENSGNVGEDSTANANDFTQTAGGGAVTLDAVDVPPGYSASSGVTATIAITGPDIAAGTWSINAEAPSTGTIAITGPDITAGAWSINAEAPSTGTIAITGPDIAAGAWSINAEAPSTGTIAIIGPDITAGAWSSEAGAPPPTTFVGPGGAVLIAPDDNADLPDGVTRAVYVGVTGDVAVHDRYANDVTFRNMAPGIWHPLKVQRVKATGTTATDLLAGY